MPLIGGKNALFSQISSDPPVTEPVPYSSVVIIHPGSLYLRIGRVSDTYPHTVPQCIARKRHRTQATGASYEDSWLLRPGHKHSDSVVQQMVGLSSAQEALQSRATSFGGCRRPTRPDALSEVNGAEKPTMLDTVSPLQWTNIRQNKPEFLIGDEALMVNPKETYNLHWPMRRGCLNVHSGPGGSISAVLQDIEDIWRTVLYTHLEISRSSIKNYRAVLLVPDIYQRRHVRDLVDLLLQRIGFAAIFVVQESVCATFGTGVSSACVVDVGDQKTSVTCVEDGLSQIATRLVMQYGGSDITRCFHWLLARSGFPYRDCRLSNRMDAMFMQDLKERYCHLEQDLQGVERVEFSPRQPSQKVVTYLMQMGDERILSALSVFFPDMFGLQGDQLFHRSEKFVSDPSDPNDDDYLERTMSRHELAARQRKRDATAAEASSQTQETSLLDDIQLDDDDTVDPVELVTGPGVKGRMDEDIEEVDTSHTLVGIHEAILMSIEKCDSDEMKKRMYSCIVVVGGGLMFAGAQAWLQYVVWTHMPAHMRLALETMDVITKPKDLDPRTTCWKGAAVMSCLDTANELWITQSEWQRYAVRVLRERAPFLW